MRCTWRQGARSVSRCFLLYPQTPFLTIWAEWEAPPEGVFAAVRQTVPGATGVERDSARAAAHSVPGDVMAAVPLPRGHLRWRCIRLADQTDVHDTLVWEQGAPVYPAERVEASGSFFTVEDTRTGETLLAARHAPITPAPGPQFLLAENCLCVLQNGCAGAPPAGTAVSSAARMISEFSLRISAFKRPTALVRRSPRRLLLHTSSAMVESCCAGVFCPGFISYRST